MFFFVTGKVSVSFLFSLVVPHYVIAKMKTDVYGDSPNTFTEKTSRKMFPSFGGVGRYG